MTAGHPLGDHAYAGLLRASKAHTRRASSWDRTGANRDFFVIGSGDTVKLLDVEGPGCVNRTYCALALNEITDFRDAILRCYWDGSDQPSVEVPMGDFFGLAHGRVREFSSAFVAVNSGLGTSHGLNAYFPMPFQSHALITLENRSGQLLGGALPAFWYHIEYETYDDPLPEGTLRFHAQFRQEAPTGPIGPVPGQTLWDGVNLDGAENYVALDTEGKGHMVGLVLEIDNVTGGWYGEGDDMVFIDGDTWPPSIHGTGSEEIFGGGACPATEYASLYSGFHMMESPAWDGLVGMYRWYVHDPIHFQTSLRWTLEHGHANNFANQYASVAYWYQEPLATSFPALPSREELRPPGLDEVYEEARDLLFTGTRTHRATLDATRRLSIAGRHFYTGHFETAVTELKVVLAELTE